MSDLVAIVYPSLEKAEAVRQEFLTLQKEYLISLDDAVIAVKTDDNKIKLHQMVNTTATGAASGSSWGLLVGMVFLMPVVGVVTGAASGALGGLLADFGINDKFMKDLSGSIQPGNAVLFLLIRSMTADKVLEEIRGSGGVVLKTSLDNDKETALREAPRRPGRPVGLSIPMRAAGRVRPLNPACGDSAAARSSPPPARRPPAARPRRRDRPRRFPSA